MEWASSFQTVAHWQTNYSCSFQVSTALAVDGWLWVLICRPRVECAPVSVRSNFTVPVASREWSMSFKLISVFPYFCEQPDSDPSEAWFHPSLSEKWVQTGPVSYRSKSQNPTSWTLLPAVCFAVVVLPTTLAPALDRCGPSTGLLVAVLDLSPNSRQAAQV